MSLPFLDHKKLSTVIMARSQPEGGMDEEHNKEEGNPLHAAASALLDAIHSKDVSALSDALEAFLTSCDGGEGGNGNFEQGDY